MTLATVADATALDAQLDAYMDSANAAVGVCSTLPVSDKANWAGFYAGWKAVHMQWTTLKDNATWYNWGGIAGELFFLESTYSQMRDYAGQFPAWSAKIHGACVGYSAPGEILNQSPAGKPKDDPSDIDKYLGYAKTAGEVAVVGAIAYGLYKVAEVIGDVRQTAKKLVG